MMPEVRFKIRTLNTSEMAYGASVEGEVIFNIDERKVYIRTSGEWKKVETDINNLDELVRDCLPLEAGEVICDKCNGTSKFTRNWCQKCFSTGKLDWIDVACNGKRKGTQEEINASTMYSSSYGWSGTVGMSGCSGPSGVAGLGGCSGVGGAGGGGGIGHAMLGGGGGGGGGVSSITSFTISSIGPIYSNPGNISPIVNDKKNKIWNYLKREVYDVLSYSVGLLIILYILYGVIS